MLTILDMNAEFAKLKMLQGRRPETPEAERQGAFARLAPYRDSAINAAKFSGESPWERHPNGDEIVQIVDGAVTFHIMTDDGPLSYPLKAGMVVIVPQGAWHRFEAPDGVSLLTTTLNRPSTSLSSSTIREPSSDAAQPHAHIPVAGLVPWAFSPRTRSVGTHVFPVEFAAM